MLEMLLERISAFGRGGPLKLSGEPKNVNKPAVLDSGGKAICLSLADQTLSFYREQGVTGELFDGAKSWILDVPQEGASALSGFLRLEPGKELMIGRESEQIKGLFSFSNDIARRHVMLSNENGELVARPMDPDRPVQAFLAKEPGHADRALARRRENLKRIREIFGGPIELLPPEEAMAALDGVMAILEDECFRPKNDKKRPGGLLDLPGEPTPILLGDLHAQIDVLLKVLSLDNLLPALERGEAYLLMLGDTVHREADGELDEMDSSLLMLDLIFRLKQRFPQNVFCLRGNHESFDEDVSKAGVPQGIILQERARALRGNAYAKRLAEYFEALPYLARSKDFVACHAGAPTRKATAKKLINLYDHPKLAHELMWIRPARPNKPGGYGNGDVKRLRNHLDLEKNTPFLVSHTPRASAGTFWPNAGDIPDHHVIYSARPKRFALYTRVIGKMMPLEYSGEALQDLINGMD
jgi:hypothetical protein